MVSQAAQDGAGGGHPMRAVSSAHEVWLSEMLLLRSLQAQGRRPNMLVVCSGTEVQTAFELVRDVLGPPFSVCQLPGPLDLPFDGRGTLLLHDIAALTLHQQIALFDWLSTRGREVQVVSMTGSQMLPLIQAGRFLEGLFYRLNTVSLVAGSDSSGGVETRARRTLP